MEKISVIIPCHNAQKYLFLQISSLLEQDINSFEIIIVDNNSTDDTYKNALEISKKYKDAKITVVQASKISSASYARNVGASHAKYDILAFCDSDDIVDRDWIKQIQINFLDPKVDGSVGALVEWDGKEEKINATWENGKIEVPDLDSNHYIGVPAGNLAIRKDIFRKVNGFDTTYPHGAEDIDFGWRVQESGANIIINKNQKILYRKRESLLGYFKQSFYYSKGRALLWKKAYDRGYKLDYLYYFRPLWLIKTSILNILNDKKISRKSLNYIAQIIPVTLGIINYRILKIDTPPRYEGFN